MSILCECRTAFPRSESVRARKETMMTTAEKLPLKIKLGPLSLFFYPIDRKHYEEIQERIKAMAAERK